MAAFYFTLTTMTSVGYGDIITWNNTERLYVIMCEFFGAIIFATIIASITSVNMEQSPECAYWLDRTRAPSKDAKVQRKDENLMVVTRNPFVECLLHTRHPSY